MQQVSRLIPIIPIYMQIEGRKFRKEFFEKEMPHG